MLHCISNVSNTYTNVFPLVLFSSEQFHLKKLLKCSDLFSIFVTTNIFVTVAPHRWYPYFDEVVGLVWSNDPESYPGGSDATGMSSLARQVKGDDPDKKGYSGPPGWGLGVRLTISPRKTYIC
jgi:hypothetical protein